MELKQIKDLMAAMGKTGTKRLRLKKNDYEIELEREEEKVIYTRDLPLEVAAPLQHKIAKERASDIPASLHPPLDQPEEASKVEEGTFITSPMVGTFYSSPGPEEPHFIKIGDRIEKDSVVCIVEAMKVMNEVKAGAEGVLAEVLVENGHPVEFGTKLFKITQ